MSAGSSGNMPVPAAGSSGGTSGGNCDCLLSQAMSLEDLQGILNRRQVATTAWIDAFETPVQKACTCTHLEIVKKLLLHEMEKSGQTDDGNLETVKSLALDIAAGDGNLETVKKLVTNKPELLDPEISGRYGLAIPVVRASNAGHREVTDYLHSITPPDCLNAHGGYWATHLLLDAIFFGFLDIALVIFAQVPPLAVVTEQPLQRSSPLRFLALKPDFFRSQCNIGFWRRLVYSCIVLDLPADLDTPKPNRFQRLFWMILNGLPKWFGITQIYELKKRHYQAQNLLQKMCTALTEIISDISDNESWKDTVYESLLEAVEKGNKEFFMEVTKCNPKRLLWISEAKSGRNLFHLAVGFRKVKIFSLIYGIGDMKFTLLRSCDKENNNILHIAAYLSPCPDHLSKISGSALKMQRESQWYEEVKSLVSEREVVQKNNNGMTPRQVFEASHEPLRKEGEEWMKYTATACSFVAALIATVTFQAIFTVPGGYDDTLGKPLLLRDLHFTAFILSDTLAFFTSCTSVLIFLSILTARYSFDDFIVSLPRKMILGLAILFFSIAAMLVAYITALSSSMRQRPMLVVPMKPLAALPGLLFLMLQYPLLKEMISSTYGKGLFPHHTKDWLQN